MAQKHNSLGRIVHRSLEELRATYDVAQAISWQAAWVTLRAKVDIQIMNRNGFKEPESVRNRLLGKHKIMLDFLEDKLKSIGTVTEGRRICLTATRSCATRYGYAGGRALTMRRK